MGFSFFKSFRYDTIRASSVGESYGSARAASFNLPIERSRLFFLTRSSARQSWPYTNHLSAPMRRPKRRSALCKHVPAIIIIYYAFQAVTTDFSSPFLQRVVRLQPGVHPGGRIPTVAVPVTEPFACHGR